MPTRSSARALASAAVDERVCACANVTAIESHYRWAKSRVRENEFHVSFKTTPARARALAAWVRARHPYDVPYLGVFRGEIADLAYARWLNAETQPAARRKRARRSR